MEDPRRIELTRVLYHREQTCHPDGAGPCLQEALTMRVGLGSALTAEGPRLQEALTLDHNPDPTSNPDHCHNSDPDHTPDSYLFYICDRTVCTLNPTQILKLTITLTRTKTHKRYLDQNLDPDPDHSRVLIPNTSIPLFFCNGNILMSDEPCPNPNHILNLSRK